MEIAALPHIHKRLNCINIGGRKNLHIREHLFVINGIMNDVIDNKDTPEVDVEIYISNILIAIKNLNPPIIVIL